ncbi:hypothetical protein A2U01_0014091, partial [Trifolium medium]|nr:hypothetical protein [Trifolium medium]
MTIENKMISFGETVEQVTVVEKVLRFMPARFNYVVCSIEESNDVTALTIDELQSSLIVHEQRMKGQQINQEEQALKVTNGGRGRGRGRNSSRGHGCSNHMAGNREWFYDFDENYRDSVKLGDDLRMNVTGKGNIKLCINGLKTNLLSIGQIQQKNVTIVFKNDTCKIYHEEKGLLFATHMSANRMYVVSDVVIAPRCLQASKKINSQLWHSRYGHLSIKGLNTLVKKEMVKGLPTLEELDENCVYCLTGKQHIDVIPKQAMWRARLKLELIHYDICGPINPKSNGGN